MQIKNWHIFISLMTIAIVAVWLSANRQQPDPNQFADTREKHRRASSKSATSSTIRQPGQRADHAREPHPSLQTATPEGNLEQIIDILHNAAVTYDPAELPTIEPYLSHPEPEIREAALDAMLTIGDASAGPMLREAAKSAPSPQEAVELIEAADFVELPPAKLKLKKKLK